MPHAFLDDLGVEAGGNKSGGMGPSKIMERYASKACLSDGWREVAFEVRVINSLSSWSRQEGFVGMERRPESEIVQKPFN